MMYDGWEVGGRVGGWGGVGVAGLENSLFITLLITLTQCYYRTAHTTVLILYCPYYSATTIVLPILQCYYRTAHTTVLISYYPYYSANIVLPILQC